MEGAELVAVETTRALLAAFLEMDGNALGGALHIVVDDGNIETEHVEWCVQEAGQRRDGAAEFLAKMLLELPIELRAAVVEPTLCRCGHSILLHESEDESVSGFVDDGVCRADGCGCAKSEAAR